MAYDPADLRLPSTSAPLGLFIVEFVRQRNAAMVVLPAPVAWVPYAGVGSVGQNDLHIFREGDEWCGLRSYVPGDPLSRVHWRKAAGGSRAWTVKRFSTVESPAPQTLLRVDLRLPASSDMADFEQLLGRVWFWVKQQQAGARLLLGQADFDLSDDEQYRQALNALAVVVEAATPRNHLHRMLVGLFLVLAAAVLTDSVLFILPLTALMWFFWRASACLYGLNWPGGDLSIVPARLDLRCMLVMTVMTALLFVTLPRFGFHSFFMPTQPRMQTSGFSDQVRLGDFARELDTRVVMRVEAADRKSHSVVAFQRQIQGRYWRGVALSHFSGRGWQRSQLGKRRSWSAGSDLVITQGIGLPVAVYREASDHAFIQLPEGARRLQNLPQAAYMDDTGALKFSRSPSRRLRLLMDVAKRGYLPLMRPPLPSESDTSLIPKTLAGWVEEVSAGITDNHQALRRIAGLNCG